MGQAAKLLKDRRCDHCQRPMIMTAKQMVQHALMCQRAMRAGLVLPGHIIRPGAGS